MQWGTAAAGLSNRPVSPSEPCISCSKARLRALRDGEGVGYWRGWVGAEGRGPAPAARVKPVAMPVHARPYLAIAARAGQVWIPRDWDPSAVLPL